MTSRPGTSSNRVPLPTLVQGQPSWRIASDQVEAFVTVTGGQLGPATFYRRNRKLRPFSVAPWAQEKEGPPLPAIIKVLRGDFFCLPFGGNDTPYKGEKHPVHGETANARWRFEALDRRQGRVSLRLSLQTKIRVGRVDKAISLVEGHNAIYSEHIISGMRGPMGMGHHAMLKFPIAPGSGVISTSGFLFGQVFPGEFESPEKGGYTSLKPGAEFTSLDRVPMLNGRSADLSRFPARRGFEDLVLMVTDPQVPFAWTAVTFPNERYVWFALKDPHVLRHTVFWLSNGGRHYLPWSGRHTGVMGIEDVTAYFHYGLSESARANPLSKRGFPTCVNLKAGEPLTVRYIMGVATIPAGFDRVGRIERAEKPSTLVLHAANGKHADARVDSQHLG